MSARILIVERDPSTVIWLRGKLENEGYTVDAVPSGAAALERIAQQPFDLVVLEMNLPDMDGLDLLARAHAVSLNRHLGLIVLSARSRPEDIAAALQAGADDYVTKRPGADIELLAKIRGRATRLRATAPAAGGGHIFSFCSSKGGTGTTALCVNIACALAQVKPEANILLVDMVFPLGTVAPSLGFESPKTVARLTQEAKGNLERAAVEKYVSPRLKWGFRVLIGANDPQEASGLEVSQIIPLFEVLRTMYDYILVDFGRTLSRISLPIIEISERIAIVLTPDISTVKSAKGILQYLRSRNIALDRLLVINNRTVGRVWTTTEDIERELGVKLDATIPYTMEYMTMAINAAVPFMEKFPEHAVSMMFLQIARLLSEGNKPKTA